MSQFLHGTIVLVTTNLLIRVFAFFHRLGTARLAGAEGIGLFMLLMPTFLLSVSLCQFGLPLAISKLIANQRQSERQIMKRSFQWGFLLCSLVCSSLLMLAPLLVRYIWHDERTLPSFYLLVVTLPFVTFASLMRSYFQGKQRMNIAATSQLIEQVARTACLALLLFAPTHLSLTTIATFLMAMTLCGELCSFFFLSYHYYNEPLEATKRTARTSYHLFALALPVTGSRLVGTVSYFFEPSLVMYALLKSGLSVSTVTLQYGLLTGFALPFLMLPSFFTYALATALLPAASELAHHERALQHRISLSIRWTIALSCFILVVCYVWLTPLYSAIFHESRGQSLIQLLCPFMPFYFLQAPLQAILHALDRARQTFWHSLIGVVIKNGTLLALVALMPVSMNAVALTIALGFTVTTLLHLLDVRTVVKLRFAFHHWLFFLAILFGYSALLLSLREATTNLIITSSTLIVTTSGAFFLLVIGKFLSLPRWR